MLIGGSLDLVGFFNSVTNDLKPYAKAQNVNLSFKSHVQSLITKGGLKNEKSSFRKFIKKIIAFTPETCSVLISLSVSFQNEKTIYLVAENTGSDLSRISEIILSTSFKCEVQKTLHGTIFYMEIPFDNDTDNRDRNHKATLGFTPYFTEINKRLHEHFKEIRSFELAAKNKSEKEGYFLRKLNNIIDLKIDDNTFKVDALARTMALSRSQLFRRVKRLTQMSPNQYMLFYRLQMAKHLLENNTKNLNISEIAYSIGFISKSHFSRAFKKQFGESPLAYQKQMQH